MSAQIPRAVFVSYASQDAESARRVCDALRRTGVEVWFDQSELRGGDAWDQKIKKQIRECALFIPIISSNTNARAEGYFRLEWKLAVDRSHLMADDAPFLVPAVIDDLTDAAARVPDRFREVQWSRLLTADAANAFAGRIRGLLDAPATPTVSFGSEETVATAPVRTTSTRTGGSPPVPVLDWSPAVSTRVPNTEWTLEAKLGEGGFGEVWLGRHQTMKERRVFKFCFREDRVRSLKRELTLFRVLKERVGGHPNIVRLLDVHFGEPPFYIEMDYVEGQSLKAWCEQQGGAAQVPLAVRLDLVAQIAEALHAAHTAGVIHRDVKPGNILVTSAATPNARPTAKLTDFGIGQVISEEALNGVTKSGFTQSIVIDSSSARSGTQLYMAPELLAGEPASAHSDLYSLGVVLFQLVVGDMHRPLTTDWERAVEDSLLREDLRHCFASRPVERFASTQLLAESLRAYDERRAVRTREEATVAARQRLARRWKVLRTVAIAAIVIGLGTTLAWFLQRSARTRWARQQALPEISRLAQAGDIPAAFALALEAEKYLPDDPALLALWPRIATKTTIQTTPAGAEVFIKEYRKPDSEWRRLGRSPLEKIRLPNTFYRWKILAEGHEPIEQAASAGAVAKFSPSKLGELPPAMVRVAGAVTNATFTGFPSVRLGDYAIDKFEVTNRQFKEFIDQGGYASERFWQQPFVADDKTLSWQEAVGLFRDATGQPGPAAWKNGTYADGEAEYPVTGVSWFEAAAYAEFAGKRLPSTFHWRQAALVTAAESIVPLSNFSRKGLARVGSYQGMSGCGAYDLAGNAKEWCWNEANPGRRYILGGAWREPEYMFSQFDALSPFDRSPLNGFRCVKILAAAPADERMDGPILPPARDYAQEKPVSDEEFQVYRRLFAYDRTALDARIDAVDDSSPEWRREKISFDVAYGKGRMPAFLFLPKIVSPPYQTLVFFPGSNAQTQSSPSSERLAQMDRVALILRGGRAVMYPIYWGTYERGQEQPGRPALQSIAYRDYVINQAKDLGRSIDYLETRSDIKTDKLGYIGFSWGGAMGPVLTAVETRIKVSVMVIGGFYRNPVAREVDSINFAPRIKVPTLMLSGRDDFTFPLETSQRPMYRFIGTPSEHKRHVLFDSGHAVPAEPSSKEIHAWLDRYIGPVK